MKESRYRNLAIGILILAAAKGFFAQAPAWKGKIETVDGIRVIRNPVAPLFGDVKFDLEQDLQIGMEDDDNYVFGVISSIQVDDDGNIYVCDIKLTRVQKYDKNGRFLAMIGKKGQGPGEYENPFEAFFRPRASSLYVRSNMRVLEYDSTGVYKTQTILRHFPYKTGADSDGNIWAVPNKIDGTKETRSVEKTGRDGETLWSSAVYPYERYRRVLPNGSMVSGTSGWEFDVHFAVADEGTIWYGYSGAYEMTVIDKDGKTLFKVVKEGSKEPFGAADKKPEVSPDFKPFFYGLTSDDAGRIYVTRANMMATAPGKPCPFDVFGRDGICLYTITLPRARVFTIKNGYLYTRDVAGEDDLPVVKRYRIKNWSSLRATAGEE
jgi:hypothetical protein